MPKKDMENVVPKREQNSTNKCIAPHKDEWVEELKKMRFEAWIDGIKQGANMMVVRFIRNKRKRHFTKSQILKAIQSDFDLNEANARQYMATAEKL